MKKVKFTTTINVQLLRKMKVYAIEHDKNINDIIEEYFVELLEKLN